jgi:hypothetical protein
VLPTTYNLHLVAYILFLHSSVYPLSDIFCPPDLIVQNHRFDLVEDLGCSASVDPSAVGISLVWIPPLLICSISIVFFGLLLSHVKVFKVLLKFLIAGLSIRNALRHSSDRLSTHLSTITSSPFIRCLIIFMTTTIAAGLVSL